MSPEAREYLETELHRYTLAGETLRAFVCELLLSTGREPYRTSHDRWLWQAADEIHPDWRFTLAPEMIPHESPELSCPSMDAAYQAVIDHYASKYYNTFIRQSPM